MTIDQLKEAIRNKPFKPYRIRTADGGEYQVKHSDMIWMNPKAQRTFIVATAPEAYAVLDLLLISALEFGNGSTSRRKSA